MCWPSMPLNWPGPLRRWAAARARDLARAGPRAARARSRGCTGAPVAHASHVGPVEGETPLGPGIPWRTQMLGESQICDRDGTILARLTLEDGEGHVAADVDLARRPTPLDPIQDRFWIPEITLTTHAAWHAMNAHGALSYRLRHARGGFRGRPGPPAICPTRSRPRARPTPPPRRAPEQGAPAGSRRVP